MSKITIGILSYNHEDFIEASILSALNLKFGNLEIIISDDCSKDKTVDVVKKILANTPTIHTVIFNQNETNLGLAGNFNKTFYELASGDFLITLGGDDYLTTDYMENALNYFKRDESLMMIDFTSNLIINNEISPAAPLNFDEKSHDINDYLDLKPISSFAPGRIFRRQLISGYAPLSLRCPTEDSVLVNRALLSGKLLRLNRNVLNYRKHLNNLSSKKNLKTLSNISIISQYISDSIHLYNNNQLNDLQLTGILKRYRYELKKRNIRYTDLHFYLKVILQKLLKTSYLITKKKHFA